MHSVAWWQAGEWGYVIQRRRQTGAEGLHVAADLAGYTLFSGEPPSWLGSSLACCGLTSQPLSNPTLGAGHPREVKAAFCMCLLTGEGLSGKERCWHDLLFPLQMVGVALLRALFSVKETCFSWAWTA